MQISLPYAVARVNAKSGHMLSQSVVERAAAADTLEGALRALADAGLPAETRRQAEEAANANVSEACALVRSLSPLPEVTDCFLYAYDALNLKSLLKARSLGVEDIPLSPCGTVPVSLLRHAAREANYTKLPAFLADAARAADRQNAEQFDPLRTDALVDKAVYSHITSVLAKQKCPEARAYFEAEIDSINLGVALRARALGHGASFASRLLLPGGSIPEKSILRVIAEPSFAAKCVQGKKYEKYVSRTLTEIAEGASPAALEKRADDYKMSLLRAHRHDIASVLPLIGHLAGRERERSQVMLLLTAKSANVPNETLMERLREAYVR